MSERSRARVGHGLPRTLFVLALLIPALAACDWSEITLLPPEDMGGVTRPGLNVVVVLEAEYAALGEALGWTGGVVPGAQVAVAPRGVEVEWEETLSDSAGVASFPFLLPGRYSITAYRRFTEAEHEILAGAGIDARVLGGGGIMSAPTREEDRPLHVQPDEPGSLVISELSFVAAQPAGGGTYLYGFIELYNAADTAIYLDGKVIGEGSLYATDSPNFPCSATEYIRNRAQGLAAQDMQAFPGSGQDYPLAPGQIVMIASEAIDHSQFGPGLLDLTNADFEFFGPGDVDNPEVPNMINVGPRWRPRGVHFSMVQTVPFVMESVDVESLEVIYGLNDLELRAIPGSLILDMLAHRLKWISPSSPPCDEMVHRTFERAEAILIPQGWNDGRSLQRKTNGTRSTGRIVLQRTRTSMIDLFYGLWTPHGLPQPDSATDQ